MSIWHEYLLYILILTEIIATLAATFLRFHPFPHHALWVTLEILLTICGLVSNGLGVIFLMMPFYDFVIVLLIGLAGIILGVIWLITVFLNTRRV
ncbi:hypothetical protein [Lentilactobacillus kisonensis]|uniref:Uncharacterized protein n=1 Tax=Lentilactobacillus kisonensis F0435 TaxID=797516 RepID=H1LEM5_9LACO|nr:hypothetical protein [Lentilactobacillus kisonensis]EHO52370.1 hypothetical protein HMPREF9104_01051 [Lentilactobacillus kisonensis F0435]